MPNVASTKVFPNVKLTNCSLCACSKSQSTVLLHWLVSPPSFTPEMWRPLRLAQTWVGCIMAEAAALMLSACSRPSLSLRACWPLWTIEGAPDHTCPSSDKMAYGSDESYVSTTRIRPTPGSGDTRVRLIPIPFPRKLNGVDLHLRSETLISGPDIAHRLRRSNNPGQSRQAEVARWS